MKRISIVLALLLIAIIPVMANDPDNGFGTIKGRVTTADGKPAASVTVLIKGTKKATVTEEDGSFSFNRIKSGNYELEITQVGYETIVQQVQVDGNKITAVSIQLKISSKELREVVVSGRKGFGITGSDYVSKMPLKNIENPQVYSSISKTLLNEQLVLSVDDALRNAPGVQKMWDATGRSGDGGSYFNMRGFIVQSTLRNGIAGNVSGITDAANLEKLEVIKGPSATLFGNVLTSYGGIMNRVTKKPYDHFGGEINYTAGSFQYNRVGIDINTPLDSAQNVLLRVNAAYRSEGSFTDNGFSRGFVFAPSLSYKVNEKLNFQFDAEFYSGQNTGLNVYFFPWKMKIADLGADRADKLNLDYKRSYVNEDLYQTSRNINFFGQMNYTISDNWKSQTIFSATNGYSDGPSPYFYLLSNGTPHEGTLFSRNDQYTDNSKDQVIELQQNFIGEFNLGRFRNRFVGGLDFTHHFSDQYFGGNTWDTITAYRGDLTVDEYSKKYHSFNRTNMDRLYQEKGDFFTYPANYITNTYSAYVSDMFNITDNFMVLAAVRLDHFNNRGPADNITGTYLNAKAYSQTFLAPKFGIVFQPVKDKISLFANYQNSFTNKYGVNGNNGEGEDNDFKPEQANQVEGGVKLDVFEGKLSASVSVYNIRVTDVIRPDAANPGFSIQDGTQISKGVDAELIANPIAGLSLVAGLAYNDSRFEKADDVNVEGLRPGTAGSPWVANWWISYRLQCPGLKGWGAGFGGNYASDNKVINAKDLGTFTLPEYAVLNAAVFYDQPKFRLSVKMDNLTNKKYWVGYTTVNPQKLRNFAAGIAFKF
ncbi:TonB-dependent receptor [Niastella populi]|uniref:TonB-dependent receptor n=1 Tax=Niastella populi TaxID=550983 RepID=A0A1V9FDT1_9BACT|nr:TonB-dependent receptor [Niastella populi]OQP56472.1 TonB-dependent receptor [Niastella populi]